MVSPSSCINGPPGSEPRHVPPDRGPGPPLPPRAVFPPLVRSLAVPPAVCTLDLSPCEQSSRLFQPMFSLPDQDGNCTRASRGRAAEVRPTATSAWRACGAGRRRSTASHRPVSFRPLPRCCPSHLVFTGLLLPGFCSASHVVLDKVIFATNGSPGELYTQCPRTQPGAPVGCAS